MSANPKKNPSESVPFTLATRIFGTISVKSDQIITLTPGLPGFSELSRYLLIEAHYPPPFLGFQCLDRPDLAFVVMDPVHIIADYQIAPLNGIMQELGAESFQDLKVLALLTIPPERPREMTANLMAPLVINLKNRRGRQFVVDHPKYSLKHRVFPT
jgi:flagellar assembly factor FliW